MSDKLNGNARLTLYNRTSNIIRLRGFKDADGNDLVLGTEADRGIVNAVQPEATITVSTYRRMKENPALEYMFEEGRQLEAKQPFTI